MLQYLWVKWVLFSVSTFYELLGTIITSPLFRRLHISCLGLTDKDRARDLHCWRRILLRTSGAVAITATVIYGVSLCAAAGSWDHHPLSSSFCLSACLPLLYCLSLWTFRSVASRPVIFQSRSLLAEKKATATGHGPSEGLSNSAPQGPLY